MLVCRFSGAIMDVEACCPSDLEQKVRPAAQLLGENCCLVKTLDLPKLISERGADGLLPDLGQPVSLAQTFDQNVLADRGALLGPPGPLAVGPPLLLLKRSLLI
jgi:hypothetical protein